MQNLTCCYKQASKYEAIRITEVYVCLVVIKRTMQGLPHYWNNAFLNDFVKESQELTGAIKVDIRISEAEPGSDSFVCNSFAFNDFHH